MEQNPLIVVEDTFKLKRGQIVETYKKVKGGAVTKDGDFLASNNYITLTEALSKEDEKRIRDMIRQQLRVLFWNLYTKQGIIVGNL